MSDNASILEDSIGRSNYKLLWFEHVLLMVGLIAIDCYIWINTGAALSQAYISWSFSRELHSQEASVSLFIREGLGSLVGISTSRSAPLTRSENTREFAAPRSADSTLPPHLLDDAVIGRMEIPRLNLNLMIREGVTPRTLRTAVGHVRSTSLPGYPGNVALAAHRDIFFRPLRDIERGDSITIETICGSFQYAVSSIDIVAPNAVSVLKAASRPTLTLITCYPFYYVGSAPRRFVVRASQVQVHQR